MTIQRVEHQRHESRSAGKALCNVCGIAAIRGLAGNLDMKRGIEKVLADYRDAKLFGICRDHCFEPRQFPVAIEKWPAVVRLASINLILKSHRMPYLINRVGRSGDASLDNFAHPVQVAIKK